MDFTVLRQISNGYDCQTTLQLITNYQAIISDLQKGNTTVDNAIMAAEQLRSFPMPISARGFEPQGVEDLLNKLDKELRRYNISGYYAVKMVKGGYNQAAFTAKADAYNDLIISINGGMDKALALSDLERIRQMPLPCEKAGFFGKKGCEQSAADAYFDDIDAYVSGLI